MDTFAKPGVLPRALEMHLGLFATTSPLFPTTDMIASGHSSTDGITVFCGSCPGNDPAYMKAATDLGEAIAASGRVLV